MKVSINAPRAIDDEELAGELERIAELIRQGFICGEVHGGWWSLEGDYPEPETTLPEDYQVRHDIDGYYVCTNEEAGHEDEGNPSVGFDGREHFPDVASAARYAVELAEG